MEFDKTLFLVICSVFSVGAAYALVAPFLPFEYEIKEVSPAYLGITISIYAAFFSLFSPILGGNLGQIGRRRSLCIGLFLLASSCFGYPLLKLVYHPWWFLSITLLLRIVQGIGAAFTFVTSYSIANERYKEHQDTIAILMKLAGGLGVVCGPSIGAFMYSVAGFPGPFLFFAFFFMMMLVMACLVIPDSVEEGHTGEESE